MLVYAKMQNFIFILSVPQMCRNVQKKSPADEWICWMEYLNIGCI